MKISKAINLIILMILFIGSPIHAKKKTQKVDKGLETAKNLMIASGSGTLGIQVMKQIINMQKQRLPQVPENFWSGFMKMVSPDQLVNLTAPIYAKHFSVKEMKEMIAFYNSPTGKKLVSKLPVITQESMVLGSQWGQQIARKIIDELKKAGHLK